MKKLLVIFLIFASIFASRGVCNTPLLDYTHFAGKKIGVGVGTILDRITEEHIKGIPAYYTELTAGIEDVRKGRIDGFMTDLDVTKQFLFTPGNEDLSYVDIPPEVFAAPSGAISSDSNIIERFNIFLGKIKTDGTLKNMYEYWLEKEPDINTLTMPNIPLANINGTLKVVTDATQIPFSYVCKNNELSGFNIELAKRFAAHEGMGIEIANMDFSAIIPYIISKKADLAIANITITEERKKSVLFSDAYHNELMVIIVKKQENVPEKASSNFFSWVKTGIERNLITESRWMIIIDGLKATMQISILAQILATALGMFLCYMFLRKNRFVLYLAKFFEWLVRGTPMVVLLMIFYYVIFGTTNISPILIAVAAFAVMESVNVGRNLHRAITTVDKTEIEAARSMGFSPFGTFRHIVFPQAVKRALPSYMGGFVELVKSTAIVGYIAIQDLSRAGDIIRSRTYDAYFPILFVALIYLAVTTACILLFKFIVKKINERSEV